MDLGHVLSILRRHWVIMLVAVIGGLALGGARYASTPRSYETTSTVFFSLNRSQTVGDLSQGSAYLQSLSQSYADVATSKLVLDPVISELGLRTTTAKLARQISAKPRTNTAILDIHVSDSTPSQAARVANSVAGELQRTVAALAPRGSASAATTTVTIISPAVAPSGAASPQVLPNLGLGLLVGLVIGLAMVIGREVVLAPVANREAAAEVTSAPVLSLVGRTGRRQRPLPTISAPRSAQAQAYSMLRTNLQLQRPGNRPTQLVVTSARPGEGRTTTAVNLAVAVAQAEHRVLLVDADLRRPAVATVLGLATADGLSTVLVGTATLEQATVTWVPEGDDSARLSVLPAGPVPANPGDLMASEAMDKLLDMVRHRYDVVIFDSSPLLQATDAAALAARVRGALLVVDGHRTRRARLNEAVIRLALAGADTVGVVLNRSHRGKVGRYVPAVAARATHR
jgi:capsular exopolysaccharide synthesis family protein